MRWVRDVSERSVREALAAAAPALADARLRLTTALGAASNPEWCATTALVDDAFIVKFAWSEVAAIRVQRERRVLQTLAQVAPGLPVPQLVGSSDDPVAFVTQFAPGGPLHFDRAPVTETELASVAGQLASFLARLHEPSLLKDISERVFGLFKPQPQGQTPAIRARLPQFLDRRRAGLVLEWCDWVDEILDGSSAPAVFVHGDLHGFNQIWDRETWTLRLIADFELAGPADAEYDLRYFPPMERTVTFVNALIAAYTKLSGRTVDVNRIMAWHIRTALGDALWRSEAGVALPGNSTPASYVDDVERKLRLLPTTFNSTHRGVMSVD